MGVLAKERVDVRFWLYRLTEGMRSFAPKWRGPQTLAARLGERASDPTPVGQCPVQSETSQARCKRLDVRSVCARDVPPGDHQGTIVRKGEKLSPASCESIGREIEGIEHIRWVRPVCVNQRERREIGIGRAGDDQ